MIRFMTLGTTHLETDDEADDETSAVADLVSQPKRLALLAFLAVDRPGSRHFRDTLVALFWPELDTDRARHALRQTLYHLRRALGPGVVLGEDRAGVGVSRERLWCDTVAFEDEVERGHLAHALGLYRGEFMPGFHSECGPTYDLWLDTVRQRLAGMAVEAAWSLADRAEDRGDTREACAWARRVVALQPYHERAGRRLARVLGASGQRVEALRTIETLIQRLEGEGLRPESETRAMAELVRTGDPDPLFARYRGGPEAGRPRPGAGDCALAVLPFTALSGSRFETGFADGLTDLLITELAQRGCGSVLSRTSVQQYRQGDRSLPAVASELGADVVVEGSVVIDGAEIRVTAQLLTAVPERHLWARSYLRPFDEPLTLQDGLAATIAEEVTAALHVHHGTGPSAPSA